eukprot:gene12210-2837_t
MAATNTRGLFLRAQRHIMDRELSKDENEEEPSQPYSSADESKESLLLQNFGMKYGHAFKVKPKKTEPEQKNGNTELPQRKVSPEIETNKPAQVTVNPAFKNVALDRFRRAGMKARLVRRVNKIVEDRLTAKQIFARFTKESTLHGFRFIFTKTFYIRRFIWFVITITMAAMFLKELTDSINLYFQHPFSTTSTIEYVNRLTFPAISFCNLNDFRFSKINGSDLQDVFMHEKGKFYLHRNSSFDLDGKKLGERLEDASHRITDMFMKCVWLFSQTAAGQPVPCNYTNITTYYGLNGQTCYTFNPGDRGHRLLTLNETGLFHAFELQLDLETHEYLKDIQEGGVRVHIHDQNETPFSSAGFAVPPGFKTFVSLNVQKIENLPPPYTTQCGSKKLKYYSSYKKSKCYLEELSKFVTKKCKCRGRFMPGTFDHRAGGACPEDCLSTQYNAQLSYARYVSRPPIGTSGITIPERFQKANLTNSQLEAVIRDNIVYLIFFFPELRVENVKQTVTYDFYKLVGDVGGQLGLMLGASVLTLVEFIDLIAFIIYHQILRLTRLKKKKKEETEQLKLREMNGNGAREGRFINF